MNKTQIAVDIFNRNARLYSEKFGDVGLYHDGFDTFCKNISKQKANILELACGPGNITQYLLQIRAGFQILATDLAPKMLELAKANNPSIDIQLLDARDIKQLNKKFDGIMCGFCLPYLSKEEAVKFIADSRQVLFAGGMLYLSTMEDDYERSGWKTGSSGEQMYMFYHEAGYLVEALEQNGFNIIDLHRKTYTRGEEKVTDLIIVARSGGYFSGKAPLTR